MAGAQALRDQITATYLHLTRLNELEETRGRVFSHATGSAEERERDASSIFSDRVGMLVAARVPALLNTKHLSPEQKLAAELQLYRREEAERARQVSVHTEAMTSARVELAEAEREYAAVTKAVTELRQHIKHNQVRREGEGWAAGSSARARAAVLRSRVLQLCIPRGAAPQLCLTTTKRTAAASHAPLFPPRRRWRRRRLTRSSASGRRPSP